MPQASTFAGFTLGGNRSGFAGGGRFPFFTSSSVLVRASSNSLEHSVYAGFYQSVFHLSTVGRNWCSTGVSMGNTHIILQPPPLSPDWDSEVPVLALRFPGLNLNSRVGWFSVLCVKYERASAKARPFLLSGDPGPWREWRRGFLSSAFPFGKSSGVRVAYLPAYVPAPLLGIVLDELPQDVFHFALALVSDLHCKSAPPGGFSRSERPSAGCLGLGFPCAGDFLGNGFRFSAACIRPASGPRCGLLRGPGSRSS